MHDTIGKIKLPRSLSVYILQRAETGRDRQTHREREIWQGCTVLSILEVDGLLVWRSGGTLGAVLTLISPFSKLTPASSELARCAEVTAGEAAESGGVTAENRTGVGFN